MYRQRLRFAVAAAAGSLALGCSAAMYGNAVGFVKVEIPPSGQYQLVALNFDRAGGGAMLLSDLFSTNSLRQNTRSSAADQVVLFNESQTYTTFYQKPDGLFYMVGSTVATNPAVRSGQGFWLVPKSGATEPHTVYLAGECVMTAMAAETLKQGYNLLGHVYAKDFDLLAIDWSSVPNTKASTRSSAADQVSFWNPVDGYTTYYLYADYTWRLPGGTESVTELVIPLGSAIWYNARNAGVELNLERPYAGP